MRGTPSSHRIAATQQRAAALGFDLTRTDTIFVISAMDGIRRGQQFALVGGRKFGKQRIVQAAYALLGAQSVRT